MGQILGWLHAALSLVTFELFLFNFFLFSFCLPFRRPSLEEADVIQNQVVAQDFIGKRGSAVNVSAAVRLPQTRLMRLFKSKSGVQTN